MQWVSCTNVSCVVQQLVAWAEEANLVVTTLPASFLLPVNTPTSTIDFLWSAVNFTVVFLSCGFVALPSEPVTALDAHWPGTDNCWLLTVEVCDCFIVSVPTWPIPVQPWRPAVGTTGAGVKVLGTYTSTLAVEFDLMVLTTLVAVTTHTPSEGITGVLVACRL